MNRAHARIRARLRYMTVERGINCQLGTGGCVLSSEFNAAVKHGHRMITWVANVISYFRMPEILGDYYLIFMVPSYIVSVDTSQCKQLV